MKQETWRPAFDKAAAAGYKVSAMTRTGHALAVANWSDSAAACEGRDLGHGWKEFLTDGEIARLLEWFADDGKSAPITFRCISCINGVPGECVVGMAKTWAGGSASGAWLVVGRIAPAP